MSADLKIEEATMVLAGLMGDLATAVFVFRRFEYDREIDVTEELKLGLYRLTLTSIFIACSKYTEFCRKYGELVNSCAPEVVKIMNQQKVRIESTGINSIRNDFIGHIHSKKLGRPLSNEELIEAFNKVIGGSDVNPFMDWVMPTRTIQEFDEGSLVGTIGLILNALKKNL